MRSHERRTTGTGRAFGYALLVHTVAIALLFVSVHLPVKSTLYAVHASPHPVIAELVNSQVLEQVRQRLAAADAAKEAKERAARAAALAAKQEAQAVVRAKVLAAEQARERTQRLAAQKREQLKVQQDRAKAERQARNRLHRIAQLKQELAAQQRQARIAAHRKRAEEALSRQLASEAKARNQVLNAEQQGVANRYLARIRQKVELNWVQPPGSTKGLECVVRVRVLPQGDVIAVRIVVSSGDPAFDRSVQLAVYRASPLPLPSDPVLAATFHQITFTFNPEG